MEIYLVGGAVRDTLLGLTPKDKDYVVVGATPQQMLEQGYLQVGADFPVFLHPQTNEEYALARTERKSGHGYQGFTVWSAPDVTLEQDLQRRDLTINSMAMDGQGRVTDPYGGLQDLRQRVLRHTSEAFGEDPLRILRIARFLAKLGPDWRIAETTWELMHQMVQSGELDHLTPERVWVELGKGLMTQHPQRMFEVLDALDAWKCSSLAPYPLRWGNLQDSPRPEAFANASLTVRFALFFAVEPGRHSAIPARAAQVSSALTALMRDQALHGGFFHRPAAERLALLEQIDAVRQRDRLVEVLQAFSVVHPVNAASIGKDALKLQELKVGDVLAARKPKPADIPALVTELRLQALQKA